LSSNRALRVSRITFAVFAAFTSLASAEVTLQPGTDRMGSDYKGFALDDADPALCQQACLDDATCKSYTYVNPGIKGPQAMCYLKNAVPPATEDECCTSGMKMAKLNFPGLQVVDPDASKLKTLTPGAGAFSQTPVATIPDNLSMHKLVELTGGKESESFARLAPNAMLAPGRGMVAFFGPKSVWGGSGKLTEPNMVIFPANTGDHPAELMLKLNPGSQALMLADCKVSSKASEVVYIVSEVNGPEQIFKGEQLESGHLLFLVNSSGVSFVKVSADQQWNFYSCEVRKL
jgi:hypothetical protein